MTIAQVIALGRKAEGTKVGYDQGQRWSYLDKKNKKLILNKETDCSALTAGIFFLAGYPINISGACWTGNIASLVKAAGGKVLRFTKKSDVRPGDAVVGTGHVILALSKNEWLSAEADEHGRKAGGSSGDQTRKEVYIRAPYDRSRGWDYILRFPADKPIVKPPVVVVPPVVVTPPVVGVNTKVVASHIGKAFTSVGISPVRSEVRIRMDKTTVQTSLDELAKLLNVALGNKKLNKYAIASFVATMLQESDWLRTTVEYSTEKLAYDPYRGRTFEQVTHKSNYQDFGTWAKAKGLISDADQFVDHPETLGDLKWAWLGGVWYFEARSIWDESTSGDFQRVQTMVNLGHASTTRVPSGWTTRLLAYRAFLQAYAKSAELHVSKTMDTATVKRTQEHIGAEVDGEIGPQFWYLFGLWTGIDGSFDLTNKSHVKKFQKRIGLSDANQDGVWFMPKSKTWGPTTTSALQTELNNAN